MKRYEIKVDEIKYFTFLRTVENYIKNTSELLQDPSSKEDQEWISKYIEKEYKIRELINTRDRNYEFYVKAKKSDLCAANEAYKNYIIAKNELEKLRKESV